MAHAASFGSVQIATVYYKIGQHTLAGTIAATESLVTYVDSGLLSSLLALLIVHLLEPLSIIRFRRQALI